MILYQRKLPLETLNAQQTDDYLFLTQLLS